MNPFEHLIHELGLVMNIPLEPDSHQSCLLTFPREGISIQIDLDTHADRILVGSQLGIVPPGPYRERVFTEAMRANGTAKVPQGVLAFSEKNDTLILFQFFNLATLSAEKLFHFIQVFKEHTKMWKEAIAIGLLPFIEGDVSGSSGMFGLRP